MKYHVKLNQRNPKREELVKKTSAMKRPRYVAK